MRYVKTPRQLKGWDIYSHGGVRRVYRNLWEVDSQSDQNYYHVSETPRGWVCICEDYTNYKMDCKHIFAAKFFKTMEGTDVRVPREIERKPVEEPQYELFCPSCGCEDVIKRGKRKTGYGENQVYGCKDCGKRFTPDHGFSRMKHSPEIITLVLDLYFKGMSFRKITDHLKQFHKVDVDHTTPMRWVKKYIKVIAKYVEKNKAEVGGIWHSDEMTIFIREKEKKGNYDWVWNVMDADTRFLLACEVSSKRHLPDAKKPLQVAKDAANQRPDIFVTDGLLAYEKAVKSVFYDNRAPIPNPHIRMKDFETKPNNNIVERLNGTFRERTKVMRGIDSPEGAAEFAKAFQVYYNYIRPHSGIGGLCPAQAAGLPIGLEGNRWKRMIELAVQGRATSFDSISRMSL